PHLEHQVVVVTEAEGDDAVEARHRGRAGAELEEHLAQARERIFVVRVEADRFLECVPSPHILLAGDARIPHSDVQLHRMRLKPDGTPDVALLVSATSCATAGVFTRNAVRAAPVVYDADLLAERPGRIRAVAMNARVANACTGSDGLAATRAMAQAAEQAAALPTRTALVLSTGVIGVPLPVAQ